MDSDVSTTGPTFSRYLRRHVYDSTLGDYTVLEGPRPCLSPTGPKVSLGRTQSVHLPRYTGLTVWVFRFTLFSTSRTFPLTLVRPSPSVLAPSVGAGSKGVRTVYSLCVHKPLTPSVPTTRVPVRVVV